MKRQICLLALDQEPLPATLRPYQAQEAAEAEAAVEWLLRGLLPEPAPAAAVEPVLQKLEATAQTEPSQVTAGLRMAFSQPGWKVNGPVYQSGGDMHVYLGEPKTPPVSQNRKTAYLVTTDIVLVIAVAVYVQGTGISRHGNGEAAGESKSENTAGQPFGGFVQDEEGAPLADVTVTAPHLGIETRTDSSGRFSFPVSLAAGSHFRLVAQKPGYKVFTADPTFGNTAFNCHLTRRSENGR